MKTIEWNDIWNAVAILLIGCIVWLIAHLITIDRPVRGYYMDSSNGGSYQIRVDIDNHADDEIKLEPRISLDSGITMMKKLNSTIKK